MAHRVTDAEVKEIIETDLDDLTAFIEPANILVTDLLSAKGYSADRLKEIERWLSAHFTAMLENKARVVEEGVGESRARYGENTRGVLGPGLSLTRYGQQALALDTSGTLMSSAKGTARFTLV